MAQQSQTVQHAADGTLSIAAPLAVASANAVWDARCDVLVVGFGAAGAAAAIAAREAGADVLIAERFEGGGATAKSGGVVYAGGGTRHQQKAGFDDTPEQMFRYLQMETGDAISAATLQRFCDDSVGLIEWLESIGANFESSAPPPKTSYPKDGIYLYYSGNESVREYAAVATPAPRGHRTRGSWLSGKALYEFLKARVQALQVTVQTQSAVRRLITDAETGAVLGAELWRLPPGSAAALQHQKLIRRAEGFHNVAPAYADKLRAQASALEQAEAQPQRVQASRGVVLSTGGFIFNREMVAARAPKYLQTMRLGTTGCDGSGIRLGESVGGVAARMDKVSAWRFINPPIAWPRGLVVNLQGQRFCNEQVYGAKLGVEMCEQHQGRAYLLLDNKLRWAAIKEALFGGLWFFQSVPALILMLLAPRGKTLAKLALKIGLPAAALQDSVDRYNQGATKHSDALGKSTQMLQALDTGPYYALDISVNSKTFPCPAITLGGLVIDEISGAVRTDQGQNITGLFAAGRAAVGIASNGYVSGLSIADCLWSGRRAGRAAAANNH